MNEAGVNARARYQDMADYPAELQEELAKLSDWLSELCRLYRHRISIRLIDAKSPFGLYKSLLHRIRRYPTFIIEKKDSLQRLGQEKDRGDARHPYSGGQSAPGRPLIDIGVKKTRRTRILSCGEQRYWRNTPRGMRLKRYSPVMFGVQ